MNEIKFNDEKKIKNFGKPYIVAEMNTSHFGKIENAKEMVLQQKNQVVTVLNFNLGQHKVYIQKRIMMRIQSPKDLLRAFLLMRCNLKNYQITVKVLGFLLLQLPIRKKRLIF